MIENLPTHIVVTFTLTAILTVFFFFLAIKRSREDKRIPTLVFIVLGAWIILEGVLGLNGFYRQFDVWPPRFILAIGPPLLLTFYFLFFQKQAVYTFPIRLLTFLHVIRIPVEIVLYWLYQQGQVPQLMTYEGRNFDILAGITAPIMAQIAFRGGHLHKRVLAIWNVLALGLLLNIVINAILSTPTPLQQFAHEQPNVAVFYFPFIWLPTVIVPIVFFCHLVSLSQLARK